MDERRGIIVGVFGSVKDLLLLLRREVRRRNFLNDG